MEIGAPELTLFESEGFHGTSDKFAEDITSEDPAKKGFRVGSQGSRNRYGNGIYFFYSRNGDDDPVKSSVKFAKMRHLEVAVVKVTITIASCMDLTENDVNTAFVDRFTDSIKNKAAESGDYWLLNTADEEAREVLNSVLWVKFWRTNFDVKGITSLVGEEWSEPVAVVRNGSQDECIVIRGLAEAIDMG